MRAARAECRPLREAVMAAARDGVCVPYVDRMRPALLRQCGGDASLVEEPVMYVGPDSLALADLASSLAKGKRVADVCAGSGVQGLVATRAGAASICWVEAEARAAAFCRLNGALNDVEGDVVVDRVNNVADGTYDVILANPPYVATPSSLSYEAFAAGGPDGYDVLKDVVTYAARHLAEDGLLACVFELNGPPEALFAKVALAWASGGSRSDRRNSRPASHATADRDADQPP